MQALSFTMFGGIPDQILGHLKGIIEDVFMKLRAYTDSRDWTPQQAIRVNIYSCIDLPS